MSGQPISSVTGNGQARVEAAIARASDATGVDFDYLLAQARLESSLDPGARAPTSSAAGLYQFTRSTWLETLSRHGDALGISAPAAGEGGAARAQALALRYDPDASAMMAAALASDNRDALAETLGRPPEPVELYLGHFLGLGGARRFLAGLAADPDQSAASLLPQAAAANRAVFFDKGLPLTVSGVMSRIRDRFETAMGQASGPRPDAPPAGVAATLAASAAPGPAPAHPPARFEAFAGRSMADTIAGAFGRDEAAPAQVRRAYAQLARFGL